MLNTRNRISALCCGILGLAFACSETAPPKSNEIVEGDTKTTVKEVHDGRALFNQHCAGCHGERGDGKGETELKTPARSFAAGGFAFGNTPEALFKTVTNGIPGQSEMPSFKNEMTDAERRAVVAHVRTLIPKEKQVDDTATIMLVEERPRIFRGMLPAVVKDAPARPRGMLLGFPGGTTFEYTVDDVRLLAVRSGGFVKRTDWTGRGGTTARPTGRLMELVDNGKPRAAFHALKAGQLAPLQAELDDSFAFEDGLAGVSYTLNGEALEGSCKIKEAPFPQKLEGVFAWGRRFLLAPSKETLVLHLSQGKPEQTWDGLDAAGSDGHKVLPSTAVAQLKPVVRKNPDDSATAVVLKGADDLRISLKDNNLQLVIPASGESRDIQILQIRFDTFSLEKLGALATKVQWQ